MKIVIAPDSFKGVLDARCAAEAMAEGVRHARPGATIIMLPMADGGEGTLELLVTSQNGQRRRVTAHGPLGEPVDVTVGLIHEAATAVIEIANVCGYSLITPEQRDPLRTSTFGLGEVIRTVVETEIQNIVLALGGSATVDGGAGMMQALGMTLLDRDCSPIREHIGGGRLCEIDRIVWNTAPTGIDDVQFTIACDVLNPACGPNGAAAVFGPQKGADAEGVKRLDAGLLHWANLLEDYCARRWRDEPGTGAAGGVALPLLSLTNAMIVPGVDLVAEAVGMVNAIADADLVLTGEGRIDRQSMMGKVVGAVGRMAKIANVPCVAICGIAGEGADECLSVLDSYRTLDGPIEDTKARLATVAAEVATRMV
ncbi:MAG: glycerate kinase [Planctomycetes bacterium]|nr:glycerate kinase [Planctomycetota bacterium]